MQAHGGWSCCTTVRVGRAGGQKTTWGRGRAGRPRADPPARLPVVRAADTAAERAALTHVDRAPLDCRAGEGPAQHGVGRAFVRREGGSGAVSSGTGRAAEGAVAV